MLFLRYAFSKVAPASFARPYLRYVRFRSIPSASILCMNVLVDWTQMLLVLSACSGLHERDRGRRLLREFPALHHLYDGSSGITPEFRMVR